MTEVLIRLIGVLALVALTLMGGALGGWLCVQWFAKSKRENTLTRTGYFCEYPGCASEALRYRQSDGRRLCAVHKGQAA